MSESQERMMAVVTPENITAFEAVMDKWAVEYSWLGEVTDTGRLIITWEGEVIVDVDPRTVAHDGPVYDRPFARPSWQDSVQADTFTGSVQDAGRPSTSGELAAAITELIASPNMCSKAWITKQYDRYVGGNTAMAFPDDAGVVRVDEETGLGVALATDANGRYTYLDPYHGAQLALAEAYRNVATSGAVPMAVSDCLNFGSPEDPDVMWQLAESIRGLSDACMELGVPVTGGNVSLYNQTGTVPIHPLPWLPCWASSTTSRAARRRAGRKMARPSTSWAPRPRNWTVPNGPTCADTSAACRRRLTCPSSASSARSSSTPRATA
ncbi:phosphoribosylformylglycinamidine synthase 2 [Arthrobacter sp. Hiyo8]|nr:phosphoribosylformylglycinamidine synthase 2 [Arthrobacter sp. Hiyo8]